ncbi:WbqC family protein [Vibrio mexicanus]|uniref:WbqC family protein n=1 Tax=Vibrio mexicanus TaxID=1004326 RepID=UPI00063C7B55|nr:WbqC family protein [Vibrio mexicanus]
MQSSKKSCALMQPYFFPYIGYFDLIYKSDVFVFYDDAKFSKNGWYNRNRVLSNHKDWDYITVSVLKSGLNTEINDIVLANKDRDLKKILGKLQVYSKLSSNYKDVKELVERTFELSDNTLSSLSKNSIIECMNYLGLRADIISSSDLDYDKSRSPEEKVLEICKSVDAEEYINLPGGKLLYSPDRFRQENISLSFTNEIKTRYETQAFEFQESLSIIDVLMWNSKDKVKEIIKERTENE